MKKAKEYTEFTAVKKSLSETELKGTTNSS